MTAVFSAEALIKIVVLGFYFNGNKYLFIIYEGRFAARFAVGIPYSLVEEEKENKPSNTPGCICWF